MKKFILFLFLASIINTISATDTKIIVRAKAKDAKFIGSSIGGAHIIIRNQMTREILAQGKTVGSTGNTTLIMKTPKDRYTNITDDQTAKFETSIDISDPTFITIEVVSPINNKQASISASTSLWLIPGKHILNDGVIIEIPGFIIDILTPRTHHYMALSTIKDKPFKIQANMVMMCGCTIKNDGLWNAKNIEVKGILKKDDLFLKEVLLTSTASNLFEGETAIEQAGNYELTVYAYDSKTGNTGVDKVNYIIYN